MHSLWDSLIWLPCGGVTSKLHIGRIPCFANALFKIQGFSKKISQNCDNCPPADKKGLWVLSGGIPENVCSLYKCLIFVWSVGSKESIIFCLEKIKVFVSWKFYLNYYTIEPFESLFISNASICLKIEIYQCVKTVTYPLVQGARKLMFEDLNFHRS